MRKRPFTFWCLMTFLLLEYMRPEPIVQLKLQMLCLILFPILWIRESRRPWSRNLTIQSLFLGVCAFSILYATNTYSAYMVTRAVYGYVVIALAITWLLSNRRDFTFAIWFWVAIMAYQACYAIAHGGQGSGGVLGDENDLAMGLNTALPFTFIGLRFYRGWRVWACGLLLLLFVTAISVSLSRGGFLGMVTALLYCVAMGRNPIRNLIIVALGSLVFLLAIPETYKEEILSIKETDSGTAELRRFFWQASRNMWWANPVLGVGAGNSSWNIGRYRPEQTATGMFSGAQFGERDFTMTQVHSMYFQLLGELGSVGPLLFAIMVYGHFSGLSSLRKRVRSDRRASLKLRKETEFYVVALGGAMMGYLAAGAFLSVAYYPYPWYFSAFVIAFTRAIESDLSSLEARTGNQASGWTALI